MNTDETRNARPGISPKACFRIVAAEVTRRTICVVATEVRLVTSAATFRRRFLRLPNGPIELEGRVGHRIGNVEHGPAQRVSHEIGPRSQITGTLQNVTNIWLTLKLKHDFAARLRGWGKNSQEWGCRHECEQCHREWWKIIRKRAAGASEGVCSDVLSCRSGIRASGFVLRNAVGAEGGSWTGHKARDGD